MADTREQIELEAAKVDLETKRMLLEKAKQDVAEFANRKENKASQLKGRGRELAAGIRNRRAKQASCNHRQGGKGLKALQTGQGQDVNYSVAKHVLPTGDTMIRCSRCGKTWIPPLEADFVVNGKLDKVAFKEANDEYIRAYNFPTQYETGSSNQIRWFRDGKPISREKTHMFCKAAKDCAL